MVNLKSILIPHSILLKKYLILTPILCLICMGAHSQSISSTHYKNRLIEESSIGAICKDVEASKVGSVSPDEGILQIKRQLNHWFNTNMFGTMIAAAGFTVLADGGADEDRVFISELYFANDKAAAKVVAMMDRFGLKNVAFLPPANWFWLCFRSRVFFMSSIGTMPFEAPYWGVIQIVMQEVHKLRKEGTQPA